jgi:hypothetical protein
MRRKYGSWQGQDLSSGIGDFAKPCAVNDSLDLQLYTVSYAQLGHKLLQRVSLDFGQCAWEADALTEMQRALRGKLADWVRGA